MTITIKTDAGDDLTIQCNGAVIGTNNGEGYTYCDNETTTDEVVEAYRDALVCIIDSMLLSAAAEQHQGGVRKVKILDMIIAEMEKANAALNKIDESIKKGIQPIIITGKTEKNIERAASWNL